MLTQIVWIFKRNLRFKNFDLFADFYIVRIVTRINSILANGEFWKAEMNGPIVPYYTDDNPSNSWPRANATAAGQALNFFLARMHPI